MEGITEKFNSLLNKLKAGDEEVVYMNFSLNGKEKRLSFTRKNLDIIIGRSEECNLVIEHNSVSRKHAHLWSENNSIWVEDLGSKNGTFVRKERVNQKTVVENELRVGEVIIKLCGNKEEEQYAIGEVSNSYMEKIAFSAGIIFIVAGVLILILALCYSFLY